MDNRIIYFSGTETNVLPERFVSVKSKRMIYASGDGYGGFVKGENYMSKTNIQAFAELGFNVFCCVEKNPGNITYLTENPDLNIVLCIMTGIQDIDYPILEQLFQNSLDIISTDDTRFFPSAKVSFAMLKVGGICDKVSTAYIIKGSILSGTVHVGDFQWGMPNFSIESREKSGKIITLKKVGTTFNSNAKYVNNVPNNTSHNENIARKLQNLYSAKNNFTEKSWANWRTRRAKKGGAKKFTIENVVFSSTTKEQTIIKKMTCNTNDPDLVGKAYADMVKVIMKARHEEAVLSTELCCDAALRPVAYIVVGQGVDERFCPDSSGFNLGLRIGENDQVGESGNSIFISDESTIIKVLTGEVDEYDDIVPSDLGSIYSAIYKEIKISSKAGTIGVGPKVIRSKISFGDDFIPVGYMAMERVYGAPVTESQIGEFREEIRGHISTLYKNGIEHGDMHNRNVIYGNVGSGEPRIWIIDYGSADLTDGKAKRSYVVTLITKSGYKPIQL